VHAGHDSGDDETRDGAPADPPAERPLSATAQADSRPTTGRGVGALVVLGLAVLLPVSWLIDLLALVQRDFGDPYGPRSEGPVLAAFVVGALLGVGVPVLVVLVQARVRRRDPSLSAASLVGAAVVLVLAVPTHGLALAGQLVAVVEEHRTTSAPPTTAERTFEGRDAGDAVRDLGEASVVALGADPATGYWPASDGPLDADRPSSRECTLDDRSPGVEWTWQWDAGWLVDAQGAPLVPEGADVLPSAVPDQEALRQAWASRDVTAVPDDEVVPDQLRPEADWLDPGSFARPGPDVLIETICLVP